MEHEDGTGDLNVLFKTVYEGEKKDGEEGREQELNDAYQQGYERGYAEGYRDGKLEGRS